MLDEYTKTQLAKLVGRKYPHIVNPPAVLARVTAMQKISDRVWKYSVKPLHADRSDADFPEIPDVKSHIEVEAGVGGIVAVALLYGSYAGLTIIDEVFS